MHRGRSGYHSPIGCLVEMFRQQLALFLGQVVVAQVYGGVIAKVAEAPILAKSLDREAKDLPWVASQRMQRCLFCDLTAERPVWFLFLPAIDQIVLLETLTVSLR